MNIAILGAGAWGTALAISLAPRHTVTLWARDAAQIATLQAQRSNPRYLPDIAFPEALRLSADLSHTLRDAELIIIATPVSGLRPLLLQIALQATSAGVLWLCKGFEADSAQLAHQVAASLLPTHTPRGVLSGPSFAQEVANGLPTALTLACSDIDFAKHTAQQLHHARLRIYASHDVVGVEVGGAVKNVLAIAAGIADGLGFGHNARAALITRGLAEMTRMGLKLGGCAETLGGLSGAGDLILTCTGHLSRNRQVGLLLAQQRALPDILTQLGHVAEGVYAAREIHHLTQKMDIEMPLCTAVYRILYEGVAATDAVNGLLGRVPSVEF
jgi:glycerol-3-phosphate dehydrogenase (NAD(P)+)